MNKYQEAINELYKQRAERYKVYQKHKDWSKEIKEYDKVGEALETLQELVDQTKTPTLKKGEEKMTDKEKMQYILDTYNPETYEKFIGLYITHFRKDFNNQRLLDLQNNINNRVYQYLIKSSYDIQIAKEKAQYVCLYLKGEMYTSKEDAIECLPLQIKHAEKVVEMLNDK